MKYILISLFGFIGFIICNIVQEVMWDIDRERDLNYEFKHISRKE